MIMPVTIEANGIETKGFKKNLEDLPGNPSVYSLYRHTYLEYHT
jgi:hypothetical protein